MITEKELAGYLKNGFSVLLEGKHGTGKTAMVKAACDALGWTMKSFTVSLMDPYIDLVGVPVPREENGREYLKLIRPMDIQDAEVIFLDELNRGEIKTLNAVLELVQFGTINGEKLPKLKAVVAAQNPAGDIYDTIELDQALVDRFDVFMEVKPTINIPYFTRTFDRNVANAVSQWYKERGPKADYISPRRMEKVVRLYMHDPCKRSLEAAMPPNGTYEVSKLFTMLQEATETEEDRKSRLKREKAAADLAKKRVKTAEAARIQKMQEQLKNIHTMPVKEARRTIKSVNITELVEYLSSTGAEVEKAKDAVASALSDQVAPKDLVGKFAPVMGKLGHTRIRKMSRNWSAPKISQFRSSIYMTAYADKSLKTKKDVFESSFWEMGKMFTSSYGRHILDPLVAHKTF